LLAHLAQHNTVTRLLTLAWAKVKPNDEKH